MNKQVTELKEKSNKQMKWNKENNAKLELDPCLSFYRNINSKWIKDLNIRPKTLKLVQERIGNTLELIGIGNNCLSSTPMA
jgi:hypothetical protein